ncbi:MAG: CRISPR-associated endonuclease Cas1 [Epsilonproteobacteria bacterium]|nr:CRISPR-associated endonuclease Cas1 [Campylobacterota bacterium]NPA56916.1 CRISPR-associated endonuclease Cas1 [Campylobacterota bacterium]
MEKMIRKDIFLIRESEMSRSGNLLKIGTHKIPISLVNNVFILSGAVISRGARKLLLKHGRAVIYLNSYYQMEGILLPNRFDSNYRKRLNQYLRHGELQLARVIVAHKIDMIEKYVNRSLDHYRERLAQAEGYRSILGVEGGVSNYMFQIYKRELERLDIWEFQRREYYPPPDRINALLSLLYTLYYGALYAQISGEGLDPYIGFLHVKRGRHAAFVSDMMEGARVELTFLSLQILPHIYPDRFEERALDYEGKKMVLSLFSRFMEGHTNHLYNQFKELLSAPPQVEREPSEDRLEMDLALQGGYSTPVEQGEG